jgi:hypothetical protein
MPLRRYLGKGEAFGPADLVAMNAAFSMALQKLGISAGDGPTAELVGRNVIQAAMRGERDPAKLCEAALTRLTKARRLLRSIAT